MRSERWASDNEKRKVLSKDAAGPVLWYDNGERYTHANEGHSLSLGVSGAGKSRRGTIPMTLSFIMNKESGVIIDPKGEIYKHTINYVTDEYKVFVLNFRKLYEENIQGWNPLSAPYELWKTGIGENVNRAEQMIEEMAHAMYPIDKNEDPFWPKEARNLFIATVYALFTYAKPEQVNMPSLYYMISQGDERIGAGTYLKEFCSQIADNENVTMQLQSYVSTASDTRACIKSAFLDGLSIATKSKSIREFLSHDDLHINDLRGDVPTLIYIILPDETPIYDDLAGVLVFQLMNHFVKLAEQKYMGKLPIRLNVCLEELGNVGRAITNLPHLLSAGRSRNIRIQLILQSMSQLVDIFGKSNADTIIDNADVKIAYRINNWETLTELSRLCGEREIVMNGHISREPLITQSQLAAMETGQALVIISGRTKFITWLPDFTEMYPMVSQELPKKITQGRKKQKKSPSYFNVKAYVDRIRDKKIKELLGDSNNNDMLNEGEISNVNATREYINTEEMIKKIEAKIAELEAQEKAEQEKKAQESGTQTEEAEEVTISDIFGDQDELPFS